MMRWDLYNNGIQFNIVVLIIISSSIIIMGSDMVYCVLNH